MADALKPFKGRKGKPEFVRSISGSDSAEDRAAAETAARALSPVETPSAASAVNVAATPDAAPQPVPPVSQRKKPTKLQPAPTPPAAAELPASSVPKFARRK